MKNKNNVFMDKIIENNNTNNILINSGVRVVVVFVVISSRHFNLIIYIRRLTAPLYYRGLYYYIKL